VLLCFVSPEGERLALVRSICLNRFGVPVETLVAKCQIEKHLGDFRRFPGCLQLNDRFVELSGSHKPTPFVRTGGHGLSRLHVIASHHRLSEQEGHGARNDANQGYGG
jgi:hypothetical protein